MANVGVPSTNDVEQDYAIRRIFTIAEGHLQDRYTDKSKCFLLTQIHDLCKEFLTKKEPKPAMKVTRTR